MKLWVETLESWKCFTVQRRGAFALSLSLFSFVNWIQWLSGPLHNGEIVVGHTAALRIFLFEEILLCCCCCHLLALCEFNKRLQGMKRESQIGTFENHHLRLELYRGYSNFPDGLEYFGGFYQWKVCFLQATGFRIEFGMLELKFSQGSQLEGR